MSKSTAVPKRVRFEVLKRDGHRCRYCGRTPDADDVRLHVDHVIPESLGGSNHPSNLVTACADCNLGKASSNPADPVVPQPNRDAQRYAAALAQAQQEATQRRELVEYCTHAFERTWCVRGLGRQLDRVDYQPSITRFVSLGLTTPAEYGEMATITIDRCPSSDADHRWKYFCAIAWNRIRAIQDRALELLAEDDRQPADEATDDELDDEGWLSDLIDPADETQEWWYLTRKKCFVTGDTCTHKCPSGLCAIDMGEG